MNTIPYLKSFSGFSGAMVDVYYNLHTFKWSVRSREKETRGKVLFHTDKIFLSDCQFVVQPAGLERVRKERVKNVHAFVRGTIETDGVKWIEWVAAYPKLRITYDPYKYDTFVVYNSLIPIESSEVCYLDEFKRVWVAR